MSARTTGRSTCLLAEVEWNHVGKGEPMIIQKDNYILDVDVKKTKDYYANNTLFDCDEDRNFYAQVRDRFPKLTVLLDEFGVAIDRPDEIGSLALEDDIDYLFVAYTVVGRIVEHGEYEIDLFDGNLFLNLVISNVYFPNEQKTSEYFTIVIYNIRLPWVLDEPFPAQEKTRLSILAKIKKWFQCR